jgi:hypothetical protein
MTSIYRVFSNDLKEFFDVDDGLADKSTEEQGEYKMEVEDAGNQGCYFCLRWRLIEEGCDVSDSFGKTEAFKKLCREWTHTGPINTSSSFAANMDYWLEEEEE